MITEFFKNVIVGLLTLNLTIAGWFGYVPPAQPQVGATIPTAVALFSTTLAAAVTSSATSFTLTTGTTKEGTSLSGTYGFIIDEGTSSEEFVSASCTATACTSALRGLSTITGNTEISGNKKAHRRGASIKITDHPQLAIVSRILNGSETIPNTITYASGASACSAADDICDKSYIDGVSIAGAANSSTTVNGISEEATAAEINAGTAAGGTGAQLYVNPSYLASSNYASFLPTTTQKDALAGTGTPSSSNKYVTADTDALKELLSNKSTDTALGSSNTLYPTQNAAKTYVDGLSTHTSGTTTKNVADADTTQTIAHGLGRTPKFVTITAIAPAQGAWAKTVYNGTTQSSIAAYFTGVGTVTIATTFKLNTATGAGDVGNNGTVTVDGTNISIAWVKAGSPTGTYTLLWEAE